MSKQYKLTFVAAAVLAIAASAAPIASIAADSGSPASLTAVKAIAHDSTTEVRFDLSAPISALPKLMTMSNPQRVMFDVPGLANGTGKRIHSVGTGAIENVQVIQAQGLSRVVAKVNDGYVAKLVMDGSSLILKVSPKDAPIAKPAAVEVQPPAASASIERGLTNVDFRRGPAGEGRVIVDLNDPEVGVEIKQVGTVIQVDFQNASVAEKLQRRMSVTDFGTPVNSVKVSREGKGVRLTIEPTGLWEYNAYQTDGRLVLEVRPVVYDPNKLAQGTSNGYKGDRMSLNFQNVDVRNLLSVIADFTKMNIITSDSVQGSMTVRLQDVPWDQALDLVLQSRGLDMRKNGNVIWVAPAEEIAKREKDKAENVVQNKNLEPLRTESFQLNYTKAEDVTNLLSNAKQKMLSERGSIVFDARTNQLFIQDSASKLADVSKVIQKIDVPVRQVMIEARIVEAGDKFSRSLGARLGFTQSASTPIGSSASNGSLQINNAASSLPAPALDNGATAGMLAVTLLSGAGTSILNLELSALEADGRGKIVSSPSVVTADKEKAIIEQGTELPYLEASSSGAATISFKKANLKLEVLPQITPDGNVIMAVDINKDAPGSTTVSGIAIDTKHVKTNVLVENGGTVVIGGIFTQDERNDVTKIPFLGDLPIVGNLFKNTIKKDNKTELMVFLTPRILETKIAGSNK